ncbi:MAG: transcriptional modulator of MazE/toxin MazF [Parcubacteria group bacterium GW2011_GWA1_47_10]|nr:MAG: transcriptional modulator of MazE/toxin MazF [Parcubacteria group bacterium GW2011_GWA1_47_10]
MGRVNYIPERGDIVYTSFSPTKGHEQRGRRPALILSTHAYNLRSQLAIMCPVTSTIRNSLFEVIIETPKVKGVILSDHVRSMSWKIRGVKFVSKCPADILHEVSGKLVVLIQG